MALAYRCAWHPTGDKPILRTIEDGQTAITYSDGMCADCSDRVRAEHGLPPRKERAA